ncbi:MAG: hypothetical protein JNK34_11135 [Tabrizicola sp.]|nr:hypothetical protein [Tabrizicola sp.]
MEHLTGRGWRLTDPEGRPQVALYGDAERAQMALDAAQARTDAARKKSVRPCMCCEKPFQSEGIHNRMCDYCRRQNGELIPYGVAPRSGRPK